MARPIRGGTQRVRHCYGELLAARDLADDRAHEAKLRGLHTRALHDTWGIALGFTVKVSEDDEHLEIAPGLAYDCYGRELVLAETLALPIPADLTAKGLALGIHHNEEASLLTRRVTTVCPGTGLDPTLERPTFVWRPGKVRLGEEVPLVLVTRRQGTLALDHSVRRNARPLVRPHIGWGTQEVTFARQDFWEVDGAPIGLGVEVNTSAAGFTQIPHYFASLQFPVPMPAFESIAESGSNGFAYRLLFATQRQPPPSLSGSLFWLGIEPVVGCEPMPTVLVFLLAGFLFEYLRVVD